MSLCNLCLSMTPQKRFSVSGVERHGGGRQRGRRAALSCWDVN